MTRQTDKNNIFGVCILYTVIIAACIFGLTENAFAADLVNGEVIAFFKKDISVNSAERITDGDISVIRTDDRIIEKNEPVLITKEHLDTDELMEDLSDIKEISHVQPNYIYALDDTDNNEAETPAVVNEQWNYRYMNVCNAWKLIDALDLNKSDRVRVAVIDTGVNYDHEDMQQNLDRETCRRVVSGRIEPYDYDVRQDNHGTKLASVIGADSNNGIGIDGLASGTNNDLIIMSCINVFEPGVRKAQYSATTADIIAGLEYARENGAKVINAAFGAISLFNDYKDEPHDDIAIKEEIELLTAHNITYVSPAGNENNSISCYPSDFDDVISVIAVKKKYKNAWKNIKKDTSSYGMQKTLSAPGSSAPACTIDGKYGVVAGTSAASAHVTSVIAMMLSIDPDLTPSEIKQILCETATDVYETGKDEMTGAGVVNAYTAVRKTAYKAAMEDKLINKDGIKISASTVDDLADAVKPESYNMILPRPVIEKTECSSNSAALKWSFTYTGNLHAVEIYRSTSTKASKFKAVKKFTGKAAAEKVIWVDRGLKSNRKYYYKIVVYCTSDDGKKVISPMSKKKTIKTRKADM